MNKQKTNSDTHRTPKSSPQNRRPKANESSASPRRQSRKHNRKRTLPAPQKVKSVKKTPNVTSTGNVNQERQVMRSPSVSSLLQSDKPAPSSKKKGFYRLPIHFKLSRKKVSILFSDIEDSTRYWDAHGDVQGRLMVDHHNRLLFPIIKKYRGRIIKTIGDAIMASFKKPGNAVKAAIAMQQVLERERRHYKRSILKVRIGIHTGHAIVEQQDVFGDMVNVAARVEGCAKGSEILVSSATASYCRTKEYYLQHRERVNVKGKKSSVSLYECNWEKSPSLIDDLQYNPYAPILRKQKIMLIFHTLATLGILHFLGFRYVRYILGDLDSVGTFFTSTLNFLNRPVVSIFGIILTTLAIYLAIDMNKVVPKNILKILNGGFGFCIAFLCFYLPSHYIDLPWNRLWNQPLIESKNLFVRVQKKDTNIRERPTTDAPVIKSATAGSIYLLVKVEDGPKMVWNQILLGKGKYGWLARVIPPKIGVPAKRLSLTDKFYYRFRDLYALIVGIFGFLWNFLRFRLYPAL
ncbi:hypothetical protein JW935_08065 [candidate division KSB1 bacterium]|nr:hypothetical protein [candidate division KSB1 bacterium]